MRIALCIALVSLLLLTTESVLNNEDRSQLHVLFYHVRKCGGWTVANFLSQYLSSISGNRCSRNLDDWRCELDRFGASSPQQQQQAFSRFVKSSQQFAHLETPLPMTRHFDSRIKYITVLRHPVPRVVSSYLMMRSKAHDGHQWSLRDWLNRSISETSIGVYENPTQERITGELDENYMTKWLSGIWRPEVRLHATVQHLNQAKAALNAMYSILLTSHLSTDLPSLAYRLKLSNTTTAKVTSHNVRNTTSIPTSFPEHFTTDILHHINDTIISEYISHTSEMTPDLLKHIVKKNRLDLELYRYAVELRNREVELKLQFAY